MGKVKQRTKGDTKPSNSFRSALKLSSSSSPREGLLNFIGFDGLKSDSHSSEGPSDIEIDQDFKLALKQMVKKDSTTKVKALQKFGEYCESKEFEVVKAVLPSWCRILRKLALDNDFRVREAVFNAHEKLVKTLGPNVAPHLKKIIAIWIISLYDTYSVAASAAKSSFDAAFSSTKQPEVLNFCREEIANYCKNIIINETVNTIEDPSIFSLEEREIKFTRLISCSLQSLSLLVSSLPQISSIEANIESILKSDKFWKLGQANDINIKVNWYKFKSNICEHLPKLAIDFEDKFTKSAFNQIDEKDPILSVAIWENVLWILVTIDTCWSHVAMKKSFFPHLRKILREGGYGNASAIFPNLLPMLSKFPFATLDDPSEFVSDFLDSFEVSLIRGDQPSKEYHAITKSYFESINFLFREKPETFKDADLTITQRILGCIQKMQTAWTDLYNIFICELSNFVINLKDANLKDSLISSLDSLIMDLLNSSKRDSKNLVLLVNLLSSLLRPNSTAKKSCVRFVDEKQAIVSLEKSYNLLPTIWKETLIKTWKEVLETCSVESTCVPWFFCLKALQEIFNEYSKEEDISLCLESCTGKLFALLDSTNDHEREKNLDLDPIDKSIISILIACSEYSSKIEVIENLSSRAFILPKLASGIKDRFSKSSFLKEWVQTPSFNFLLSSIAKFLLRICNQDSSTSLQDLHDLREFLWFTFKTSIVHHPSVNNFCEIILDAFEDKKQLQDSFEPIISILTDLFQNYSYSGQLDSFDKLICKILYLSLRVSTRTRDSLVLCWTTGFKAYLRNLIDKNFDSSETLSSIIELIRSSLFDSNLSAKNYQSVIQILDSLFDGIFEEYDCDETKRISINPVYESVEKVLSPPDGWLEKYAAMCPAILNPFYIKGILLPPINQSFSTAQVLFDEQIFFSLLIIIETLSKLSFDNSFISKALSNQVLFFAIFIHESLQLLPSDFFLPEKDIALKSFNSYITQSLKSLSKRDLQNFLKQNVERFKSSINKDESYLSIIVIRSFREFCNEEVNFKYNYVIDGNDHQRVSFLKTINSYLENGLKRDLAKDACNKFICFDKKELIENIGYLSVLDCMLGFTSDFEFSELVQPAFQKILMIKAEYEDLLVFESNLNDISNAELVFVIEVVNFFITVVENFHAKLDPSNKDFIILSTTAWMITIGNSDIQFYTNPIKMAFSCRIFSLFLSISKKIETEGDGFASLREWTDFHLLRIARPLIPLFLRMNELHFRGYQHDFIYLFGKCVASLPIIDALHLSEALEKFSIESKQVDVEKAVLYPIPAEFESIIFKLNSFLVSKYPAFYISIHTLIQKLIPSTVSSTIAIGEDADDDELLIAPPRPFMKTLLETDVVVQTMLSDYPPGETCCLIEKGTDSFKYTVAYLLNWLEILNFFSHLTAKSRSLLAKYLTDTEFFARLMDNLFRLMPLQCEPYYDIQSTFIKNALTHKLLEDLDESHHVQAISCRVYYQVLRKMPACVRLWWGNLEKRIADVVNSYTVRYFSDLICLDELRAVQDSDGSKFKEMTVKARTNAKEVVAIYSLEHMSIEMVIKLADNHPLTPPQIDGGKCVGMSMSQWRTWLLQLTSFVTYQNGTVYDGLVVWMRNMCKRFEGLEECMICYYILHGSTCQTPKLSCKNCKKKFHSACLYKWFQESNASTCPLCRYQF